MKKILWLILLAPVLAAAQVKFEVQEFTGTVTSIELAWRFSYERLRMDVDGKPVSFLFYPNYGKFIVENVKIGDRISLRVKINLSLRQQMMEMKPVNAEMIDRFSQERIVEIKIKDSWTELPEQRFQGTAGGVLLEKKVVDIYKWKDRVSFIFNNGLIGHYSILSGTNLPAKDIRIGDVVSFTGYNEPVEGAVFPVPNVKAVYFFNRLQKESGKIKSYLYKQNGVCLGVVLQNEYREFSVSFPSDYAVQVRNFLSGGREVDFYYLGFKIENQSMPPELHALVAGADTLKIEKLFFYGGEDVQHDHTTVEIKGAISSINRTNKGKVMSIMVGNDVYVEVDPITAEQLGQLIKRGNEVVITGDERIKKEGEVYQKDFRIIIPRTIKVAGKEFIIK